MQGHKQLSDTLATALLVNPQLLPLQWWLCLLRRLPLKWRASLLLLEIFRLV